MALKRKRKAVQVRVATTVDGQLALEGSVTLSPRVAANPNHPGLLHELERHWKVINRAREQGKSYLCVAQEDGKELVVVAASENLG